MDNEAIGKITFHKLFDLLNKRGLKKKYLLDNLGLSPTTISKLNKGGNVTTDVIAKICYCLDCQPEDIMEYVEEEKTYNSDNKKSRSDTSHIKFYKLFDMLERKHLKKGYLIDTVGLSPSTVAKIRKGSIVTTEVISRLCECLDCQPADIMEYVKEESGEPNEENND